MSLNNKLKDLTIHDADTDMEASPPHKTEGTRATPAQQKHVFTFVTVYYKHGEWGTRVYDTFREGLLDFVDSTASASERKDLVSLDDEELVDKLLEIGMYMVYFWPCMGRGGGETLLICGVGKDRIDKQIGSGLVGIIKGPRFDHTDGPTVYLEMYYKRGEWKLTEGYSTLLDDAMEYLEREMGEEEWNELDEDEQMEVALEQSSEDVDRQRGWGVVETFPGEIYATLDWSDSRTRPHHHPRQKCNLSCESKNWISSINRNKDNSPILTQYT